MGYFGTIEYLAGGADSGFRHVTPDVYEPRLLHFTGTSRKNVTVAEVLLSKNSIKPGDIYILDLGTELIQWNGSGANMHEKSKAMQYLMELKNKRSHENMTSEVYDEGDDKEFWELLLLGEESGWWPTPLLLLKSLLLLLLLKSLLLLGEESGWWPTLLLLLKSLLLLLKSLLLLGEESGRWPKKWGWGCIRLSRWLSYVVITCIFNPQG